MKSNTSSFQDQEIGPATGPRLQAWVRGLTQWRTDAGVLASVQTGIAAIVLPLAVLGVLLAATDVTVPMRRSMPAAAALAVACWLWWRCTRGAPSRAALIPAEAALLFMGLLLEGKGAWVFSAISIGICLRAAFGTHREFLLRGAWWSCAAILAVLLRDSWGWNPFWLRVVDSLWFPPSYLFVGGLIRVVVSVLERHEKALARERVLLGAGVALASSTSREDVYQVALDAVAQLLDRPGIEAEITEKPVEGSIRMTSRQEDHPADIGSPAAYEMRLEVRRELLTVITVKSSEALPRDSVEALQRLEANLALAIRSASLTEELRRQAHYDALTGLPNRALFYERLELALSPGQSDRVAVLLLDLDGFKLVNDSLGHDGGDRLLAHVGKVLQTCARESDTPARLGGDEFAVLLVGVDDEDAALGIADRIVTRLASPAMIDGTEIVARGSIGVALWDGKAGLEELLRAADTAMYSAKSAGKSRSHLFRRSMLTDRRPQVA